MTQSSRRGFMAIMTGTAIGQVVTFAAAPILSRIYEPRSFGVFSVVAALATVLASVAALRFDLAVAIPRSARTAISLVAIGCGTALVVALVLTPALWWAGPALSPRGTAWSSWLWLVPLLGASMAIYRVLNALAVRQGRFNAIARRNVLQSGSVVVAQLASGLVGYEAGGLLGGLLFGQAVGVISLLFGTGVDRPQARVALSLSHVASTFGEFRRFSLALMPAGFLNALGVQAAVIGVGLLYGAQEAGWLGLAQRVLSVPVTLIGQAAGQVYLSELALSRRESQWRELHLFHTTSLRLSAVGAVAIVSLLVLGPWAFGLVFGAKWHTSGLLAQALAITLAGQLVASPISQTLIVYGRAGMQLAWDAGRLGSSALALFVPWALGANVVTSVWCYSVVGGLFYLLAWELSRRTIIRALRP